MSKFLMTFPKSEASALLEYDDAGFLLKYELTPGTFQPAQFEFMFARFPSKFSLLEKWIESKFPNVSISLVQEDLSFENFYNLYANKVSKKATAEKIWSKMPDTEKAKAIKYIQWYDQRLRMSGINKKYPESYLNAQEWNN